MRVPKLTLYFIRAAMVYLGAGFTVGALYLIAKAYYIGPWIYRLLPAHYEFLLVGWSIQLAMGVEFSILPRFAFGASRGNETPVWIAFWVLNPGILLVAASPFLPDSSLWTAVGRGLEIAGMASFILHLWPRVKPRAVYPPAGSPPSSPRNP